MAPIGLIPVLNIASGHSCGSAIRTEPVASICPPAEAFAFFLADWSIEPIACPYPIVLKNPLGVGARPLPFGRSLTGQSRALRVGSTPQILAHIDGGSRGRLLHQVMTTRPGVTAALPRRGFV